MKDSSAQPKPNPMVSIPASLHRRACRTAVSWSFHTPSVRMMAYFGPSYRSSFPRRMSGNGEASFP